MSVFPVFTFERHREAEVESGGAVVLAGTLLLNTFGRRRPTRRQRLELEGIIRSLTNDAQASRMSPAEARHRAVMTRRAPLSPSMIRGCRVPTERNAGGRRQRRPDQTAGCV
jgi:hypothetical protein